jgi:hypothetical protein
MNKDCINLTVNMNLKWWLNHTGYHYSFCTVLASTVIWTGKVNFCMCRNHYIMLFQQWALNDLNLKRVPNFLSAGYEHNVLSESWKCSEMVRLHVIIIWFPRMSSKKVSINISDNSLFIFTDRNLSRMPYILIHFNFSHNIEHFYWWSDIIVLW